VQTLAKHYKFSLDTPWQKLPDKARNCILYGSEEKMKFTFSGEGQRVSVHRHVRRNRADAAGGVTRSRTPTTSARRSSAS